MRKHFIENFTNFNIKNRYTCPFTHNIQTHASIVIEFDYFENPLIRKLNFSIMAHIQAI